MRNGFAVSMAVAGLAFAGPALAGSGVESRPFLTEGGLAIEAILRLADGSIENKRPQLQLADGGTENKRPQLERADGGTENKRPQQHPFLIIEVAGVRTDIHGGAPSR